MRRLNRVSAGHGIAVPARPNAIRERQPMTIYRHIYEQHYGPIPKDKDGRTYDIHHLDGNRDNNDPLNLVALSIQEHYEVHYKQGDYDAAQAVAIRMQQSSKLISELATKANLKKVKEGTHHFLASDWQRNIQLKRVEKGTHHFLDGVISTRSNMERVENGTHHLLGGAIQKETNRRRIEEGIHQFLGGDLQRKRLENGTHNFQTIRKCPHCDKVGKGAAMQRWHFDNCKEMK